MSDRQDELEFYVGYLSHAPTGVSSFLRWASTLVVMAGLSIGVVAALVQRPLAPSVFEFGTIRPFEGTVHSHPTPRLLVARPGVTDPGRVFSAYLLIGKGKRGAGATVAPLDGQRIRLEGTLIHRGNGTMIELASDPTSSTRRISAPPTPEDLGRFTLIGEIVDSKCFLGVMNPGSLKTHRSCAVRCVSGGVPPLFTIRDSTGTMVAQLLLTTPTGAPYGSAISAWVGEPLRVTGRVQREGDLLFLQSDLDSWERVP